MQRVCSKRQNWPFIDLPNGLGFEGGLPCWLIAVMVCISFGSVAEGKPFTVNRELIQPELELPVRVTSREVVPTRVQIEKRVRGADKDARVEPIYLQVPVDDDARASFSLTIARPKKYRTLMIKLDRLVAAYLRSKFAAQTQSAGKSGAEGNLDSGEGSHQHADNQNNSINPLGAEDLPATIKVKVQPYLYNLISSKAIRDLLKRNHLLVTVDGAALQSDGELSSELLSEMTPFVDSQGLKKVWDKIKAGRPLVVDEDLLPDPASKKVGQFEVFRGPNCFMTALGFQYPKMIRNERVNIRVENNHHESMINNDELWRVLQSSFYEVDPARTKLKYGDMLVFFSVPNGGSKLRMADPRDISYRWIKHATTFLFSDFVYSKGSKSPNSPYVVGTLRNEWGAWEKHIEKNGGKLGVKVFRKPLKNATSRPPKSLEDWMY